MKNSYSIAELKLAIGHEIRVGHPINRTETILEVHPISLTHTVSDLSTFKSNFGTGFVSWIDSVDFIDSLRMKQIYKLVVF